MKVLVIGGPTGVGKSKLALELAKNLNGEIINADSTQIFEGMEIATAKEVDGDVPHHLFSFKKWHEEYSVFDYQKDVRKKIFEIQKRKKIPIIVGGTGLYIKAGLYDYNFINNRDNKQYDNLSTEELYDELKKVDPNIEIHPNNRVRLINALSYYEITKQRFSDKKITDDLLYDTIFIGLTIERKKLYNLINNRVDNMLAKGLLQEAKEIYDSKIKTKAVLTPIGYQELFAYFSADIDLEAAINLMKKRTRNYAKRQYTWFNNQLPMKWFEIDESDFLKTSEEVIKYVKKQL